MAMKYELTSDLMTGNSLIDAEHKQLFDAINDLMDACAQGVGREKIMSTTQFLNSYVNKSQGSGKFSCSPYFFQNLDDETHRGGREIRSLPPARQQDLLAAVKACGGWEIRAGQEGTCPQNIKEE